MESGEGIESLPVRSRGKGELTVESGEGIERFDYAIRRSVGYFGGIR